jgi:hypothetical protein
MEDIYYQKYLKYKNKYLSLKSRMDDQYAGAKIDPIFIHFAEVTGYTKDKKLLAKNPERFRGDGTKEMIIYNDETNSVRAYNGTDDIVFGTITDTREQGGKKRKVTTPYLTLRRVDYNAIGGGYKEHLHQIVEAFGSRDPNKIIGELKKIANKKQNLDGLRNKPLIVFHKPCFKGFSLSKKCQLDRGEVRIQLIYDKKSPHGRNGISLPTNRGTTLDKIKYRSGLR